MKLERLGDLGCSFLYDEAIGMDNEKEFQVLYQNPNKSAVLFFLGYCLNSYSSIVCCVSAAYRKRHGGTRCDAECPSTPHHQKSIQHLQRTFLLRHTSAMRITSIVAEIFQLFKQHS